MNDHEMPQDFLTLVYSSFQKYKRCGSLSLYGLPMKISFAGIHR